MITFNPGLMAQQARLMRLRLGVTVLVEWVERTGGTLDTATGSMVGSTLTSKSETIKALRHDVTAKMVEKLWSNLKVGDVILEVDPTFSAAGREALRFAIDGERYEAQPLAPELKEMWDSSFAEFKTFKTLLLRSAL